jgi:hypothetical protein
MATTNHLGLTLLEQSQAQKDVTANEAFARIDAILNTGMQDHTQSAPPLQAPLRAMCMWWQRVPQAIGQPMIMTWPILMAACGAL